MRKDMNKVLIERTRAGGKGKQRKKFEKVSRSKKIHMDTEYGVVLDDAPQKVSMRRPHTINGNRKYFTDHISPLIRFLQSKAGTSWDDVWSEICQVMKGNGLQAAHIKGHVKDFVGGIPHPGVKYYGYESEAWTPDSYDPVYVDSEGILRKNENYGKSLWKNKKKKTYNYYRESETVEYHKLNGAWFRVEIGSEPVEKTYISSFGGKYIRQEISYFPIVKKTLSKKEIKELDLYNRIEYTPPKLTLES